MRWSDINLRERRWTYQPQKQKESKKEEVHVPLSEKVIETIKRRQNKEDCVFETDYLVVRRQWIKMRLGLPCHLRDLTIHDLKRTHVHVIGSKDFLLVQHSLQHKVGGATGHYVRSSATFEERKKGVDKLTNQLFK